MELFSQGRADVPTADRQIGQAAMVGQGQHTQSEGPVAQFQQAGGRTDPALEVVADHTLARAHVPLGKVLGCGGNGLGHMAGLHRAAPDIGQGAVVALAHHGVDRAGGGALPPALLQQPGHRSIVYLAYIQSIGEKNGGFQLAQLIHLNQSLALTEAVEHDGGGGQLVIEGIFRAGEDGGQSGFVSAGVDGDVAHGHPGHIGDFVALAGGELAHGQTQVPGTELRHNDTAFLVCWMGRLYHT